MNIKQQLMKIDGRLLWLFNGVFGLVMMLFFLVMSLAFVGLICGVVAYFAHLFYEIFFWVIGV